MKIIRNLLNAVIVLTLATAGVNPYVYVIHAEAYGDFEYRIVEDHAVIEGYTGSDSTIHIPEKIGDYTVTVIGDHAFEGQWLAGEITIPDTVTEIQERAFNGCTFIKTMDLPDHLVTLGNEAFYGCTRLESVTLNNELQTIGTGAFFENNSLKEITIPSSVTSIGAYAFGCIRHELYSGSGVPVSSLKSVTFAPGSAITEIPDQCFQHCVNLETIQLPATVTVIGKRAFESTSLMELPFSETASIEKIDDFAFRNATSLMAVSTNAKYIGSYAFAGCLSVSAISLPMVESIGTHAFETCGSSAGSAGVPEIWNGQSAPAEVTEGRRRAPSPDAEVSGTDSETGEPAAEVSEGGSENANPDAQEKQESKQDNPQETGSEEKSGDPEKEAAPDESGSQGAGQEPQPAQKEQEPQPAQEEQSGGEQTEPAQNNEKPAEDAPHLQSFHLKSNSEEPAVDTPAPERSPSPDVNPDSGNGESSDPQSVPQTEGESGQGLNPDASQSMRLLQSPSSPQEETRNTEPGGMTFTVPATLIQIAPGAFAKSSISYFYVDAENPVYTTDHMALFQPNEGGETKTLIAFAAAGCSEYAVPNDVTVIGQEAFRANQIAMDDLTMRTKANLLSLTIPDSVVTIENEAFASSFSPNAQAEVTIPDTVTFLGEGAFRNNEGIQAVSIGNGIEALQPFTFTNNANLKTVTFSADSQLRSIGEECFGVCKSLSGVIVPSTVQEIGVGVFADPVNQVNWNGSMELVYADADQGAVFLTRGNTIFDTYFMQPTDPITVPAEYSIIRKRAISFPGYTTDHPCQPTVILLGSSYTIEDEGIGMMYDGLTALTGTGRGNYMNPADTIVISASNPPSEDVKSYCGKYQIGCFDANGFDVNKKQFTLGEGEQDTFQILNSLLPVYYFSSDSTIATVDQESGVITGVSEGETTVVGTTGGMRYPVKVTVTSGSPAPKPGKENTFLMLTKETIGAWEEDYYSRNSMVTENNRLDYISTIIYSGEAYRPMCGLQYRNRTHSEAYLEKYVYNNLDYQRSIEQFNTMNDNLDMEVKPGDNGNDNLIVYSGTSDVSPYTGKGNTLEDMLSAVGTIVTFPPMISTSLSQAVSIGFAGNSNTGTMLEIYLPRGMKNGTYIKVLSIHPTEYELLLKSGVKFWIFEAGVRETVAIDFDRGDTSKGVQRYMKLLVLDDEATEPPSDFHPYITTEYPSPEPTPTPTPTPVPTPTPTPEPKPTAKPTPTAAPSTVVTCQDAGYPVGWYWDDEKKACVAPAGTITPKPSNNGGSGQSGTGGKPSASPSASPTASPSASPKPSGSGTDASPTPSGSPQAAITPSPSSASETAPGSQVTPASETPEAQKPMQFMNPDGSLWFLAIPLLLILSAIGIWFAPTGGWIALIIGADAVLSGLTAFRDHSLIGWILLVLNLAAVALLAMYKKGQDEE